MAGVPSREKAASSFNYGTWPYFEELMIVSQLFSEGGLIFTTLMAYGISFLQ